MRMAAVKAGMDKKKAPLRGACHRLGRQYSPASMIVSTRLATGLPSALLTSEEQLLAVDLDGTEVVLVVRVVVGIEVVEESDGIDRRRDEGGSFGTDTRGAHQPAGRPAIAAQRVVEIADAAGTVTGTRHPIELGLAIAGKAERLIEYLLNFPVAGLWVPVGPGVAGHIVGAAMAAHRVGEVVG